MGCTHGYYKTRLQRLGQSYTLCSFALLCGLSLRQTGLWLKKEKSALKTFEVNDFLFQISVG
jgi:hypothetical protein